MAVKKIATLAVLTTLMMALAYLERMLPGFIPLLPYCKLGLSNIVLLFAIYALSKRDAFFLLFIKLFLSVVLFGSASGFLYALLGGILALAFMCAGERTQKFSVIGVSIIGALFHNAGQMLAAMILLKSGSVFYMLPLFLLSGVLTGLLTGIIAQLLISRCRHLVP